MKIKTVGKGAKVGTITFEEDPTKQIKFWVSAPFADSLVQGAEGTPTFRTEPAKGEYPEQKFMKSWNGIEEKAAGRGGGGGFGGSKLTPEQFVMEKRSILASVALKEAREFEDMEGATAESVVVTGKKFYDALTAWAGVK